MDPTRTFQSLGASPPIWPGYLLQMVAGLIGAVLVLPKVVDNVTVQLAASGATPEALAIGKWSGVIGGVLGNLAQPLLAGLVVSLLALLVGQFLGGSVTFRAYFGMIGYARVPLAINVLVASVLASRAETLEQMATMSLSPAAFLPSESSVLLRSFLTTLNPLDIWYYILLASGFAALHKVKPIKGAVLSLIVYLLVLGMAMAGTAFTGAFMG
jgi:hypothetical protein